MKYIAFFAILLFFTAPSGIKVTYQKMDKKTFIMNSNLPVKVKRQKMKDINKSVSYDLEIVDNTSHFSGGESPTIFYKDKSKGEAYMLLKQDSKMDEPYAVKWDVDGFDWRVSANEKRKILGYDCVKAECTEDGFEYTVWFAPELKFSDGPYRFFGLNGLILEVENKAMIITASNVELNAKVSFMMPDAFQFVSRGFLGNRLVKSKH
ncbi:MAG TPA: GLPGLI family protein [Bacteroidetes bacterium]|nr:GLPGLI family protein [Bacteroidota bacterium]